MTDRFDVVVIGAGHNGLVCASYLAKAGLGVACVDSNASAGGMAAARTFANDYRVPGIAHFAYPPSAVIRRDLELDRFGFAPGDAVDTVALDRAGEHLSLSRDSITGTGTDTTEQASFARFHRQVRSFANALRPLFESAPPRLKNLARADQKTLLRLGWNLRVGLGKESMYEFLRIAAMNINDVLDDEFTDDRVKGAIAADAVLGNAIGPRSPGSVLTWLQRHFGMLNGPMTMQSDDKLIASLGRSAEHHGAVLRLNTAVDRILTADGTVTGVRLDDGDEIRARTVVSSVDPRRTFLQLVGPQRLDAMFANRVQQIRGSGVVAKLHLALDRPPEFTGLGSESLSGRLLVAPSATYVERAFNASKYGRISDQPVLEIAIPSMRNAALAPERHHVMSVNAAFVPYALAGGWAGRRESLAGDLIGLIGQYAPGFEASVVGHELLTPADIESEYGAMHGHWHHGDLSIHQSFMLRPVYGAAQYRSPVDGLYLCGAGSHPGGGLSGLPGRNAAEIVLREAGK